MRLRSVLLAGVALAAMGAATGAARVSHAGETSSLKVSLRSDLAHYLNTYRAAEHVSATSLSVTFRGHRPSINLVVGRTRYRGGSPVSRGALWQIGSNTKAFTAVLLLKLEAKHKLSINDTLGKWLPQYPAWRGITIKQLLNMTAGIEDYGSLLSFYRGYASAPHRLFRLSQLVSYAVGLPVTTGYRYSNTTYVLAQMIIQRVTHDSYADQLRRQIFRPLGLHNTFFSATRFPRAVIARLPAGYYFLAPKPLRPMVSQIGKDQSRLTSSWQQAGGGIVSSTQDVAKWARALYTGRELPPKQQRELESLVSMRTSKPIRRTTPDDPGGFGLGVSQQLHPVLGGRVWIYLGETLGFRFIHVFLPRSGTIIAIALNSKPENDHILSLLYSIYHTLNKAGIS